MRFSSSASGTAQTLSSSESLTEQIKNISSTDAPYDHRSSSVYEPMSKFCELRLTIGLTQEEVSDLLRIPVATVAAYDAGDSQPSSREIQIIKGLGLATAGSRPAELVQDSNILAEPKPGPHPHLTLAPPLKPQHNLRAERQYSSQISLPGMCPIEAAVRQLATAGVDERGAVFTKRKVVEFILDLVGYRADRPLHEYRLLEPSFGDGDFLFPALDRLFAAYEAAGRPTPVYAALNKAVFGVELHRETHDRTVAALRLYLAGHGLSKIDCQALSSAWLHCNDFLLTDLEPSFTQIVGNPPYVRQELIPDVLMTEYRRRYSTIYDRADLYIPFLEHALRLLAPGAALAFICADRWMKNRYGGPLRRLVAEHFRLRTYIDMIDTPAFHTEVMAYPAIFVIANEAPGPTRLAARPSIDGDSLKELAEALTANKPSNSAPVTEISGIAIGSEPWILDSCDELAVVRRLERDFPLIEEAGCKVGIGVATGADHVFVAPFDKLDIEDDRKLPLVMCRDIVTGSVKWQGNGVLNPFADDGKLVPLAKYPRLAHYLETHGPEIRRRHVSKKNPNSWYRTIDRIYPSLTFRPKLLIPDIKGEANIVLEDGKLYPHHNLYFIVSDDWDLRALQAVLLSGIARLFVATYTTRMRGGYLRFQAQYLRRIRIPRWQDVPHTLKIELIAAAGGSDKAACKAAVFQLYGLTKNEETVIRGNGN
jgi:DNA-binding transcriptional regulator YiaG